MPRQARQSPRTRALIARQNRAEQRNSTNFITIASEFDEAIERIEFLVCHKCRRAVQNNHMSRTRDVCLSCTKESSKQDLFWPTNGFDFGEIPEELKNLTLLEQILIARVHPVVSVFKIKNQQRGYSGHVLNLVQHVEQVATRLPHDVATQSALVLLHRDSPDGVIEFRVRAAKVRHALIWLRRNNQFYRDIVIDESRIENLPADGYVADIIPRVGADESDEDDGDRANNPERSPQQSISTQDASEQADAPMIERSCFPNIDALDADSAIRNRVRQRALIEGAVDLGSWPDLGDAPEDEFSAEGLICKAFPVLFPYGRGDLRAPRIKRVTPRQYFQFLMQYKDGRFANDHRFPYYAYNSLARWDAINCGNVFLRVNNFQDVSNEALLNVLNDQGHELASSIMYYGSTLRGTRPFWKQRCSELTQMVRQIGLPTIFFTLSAADYHWPDLFRLIVPGQDPAQFTERERHELMHDNPFLTANFFNIRAQAFIDLFIKRFFPVADFWYRFEWQHRGSPHVHGLLWLDDSPDCSNIDSLDHEQHSSIISFFDRLVSAQVGARLSIPIQDSPCRQRFTDLTTEQKSRDLDRMLNAVQRHSRCGTHCLRKKRGTSTIACRYGFPIEMNIESRLIKENGVWKFYPKRNDEYLQRYNRFVTQVWRGNTDFSAITSRDAVLHYIAKYASKGEQQSETFSEILRRVLQRNPADTPAKTLVRQLLITSVAERNFSAQEVAHLISGWPLFHASRTFVVLSLKQEWRQLDGGTSIVRRYMSRPQTLEEVTLFDFARFHNYRTGGPRMKECIVRVVPHIRLSDDAQSNEEYFKLQCSLHIPWRTNPHDMLGGLTWEEFYLSHLGLLDEHNDDFGEEFPHLPDEIEFEQEPQDIPQLARDAAMVASRLMPNFDNADALGSRPIDQAHEWSTLSSTGLTIDHITSYLRSYRSASGAERTTQTGLIERCRMSDDQRRVMDVFDQQLRNPYHQVKRVLVQGKAGSGKSAIIKAICSTLDRALQDSPEIINGYAVLAPTGASAVNVDGKTIHSYLRIPAVGQLHPLNGENLRTFQLQLSKVRFILVDEYSMIGLRLFLKMHERLCQGRGSAAEPFGGYFLYFFGDLRQLPPVRDVAMFMEPSFNDPAVSRGRSLVNSIQKAFVLSTSHRQADDQAMFRTILDGIATGNITHSGWQLLMSRRVGILSRAEVDSFRNIVHLFPTNNQVTEFNEKRIAENRMPVARIEALHNNIIAKQADDGEAQGLSRELYLSIGSRVILRKNLCVAKGLVNGSQGTVTDIIYMDGEAPPSLPYVILINFDTFRGPYLEGHAFPVRPVSVVWRASNTECSRCQFPLTLAYALTIHKSQGLTLSKAAIDIGPKELASGLAYVGLSRVKRLDGLMLLQSYDLTRFLSIGRMRHTIERERFISQRFGRRDQ